MAKYFMTWEAAENIWTTDAKEQGCKSSGKMAQI